MYAAVLPLLGAGAVIAVIGAIRGREGGVVASLAALAVIALVAAAPVALYRRQYRNRVIMERWIERSELCPDCGHTLESLIRPVCPGCGLDFREAGSPQGRPQGSPEGARQDPPEGGAA